MNIFVHLIPQLSATCVKSFLILPRLCYAISISITNTCMNVMFVPVDSQFASQLQEHKQVHQTQGDWVCFKPKCGKRFKRESELNAHLVSHNKKKFQCDECPYKNSDPGTYMHIKDSTVTLFPSSVHFVVKDSNGSNNAFVI